jgi:pyrimidine-specific ribonucleoside hydrolase
MNCPTLNQIIKMKKILFLFVFIFTITFAQSSKKNIIIDTDMSLDDIRAITYFSKLYDYNVIGYVSSEGIQSAGKGAHNLKKLLKAFENNTEVFQGVIHKVPESKARKEIYELNWDMLPEVELQNQPIAELAQKINQSKDRFTYIALGPLSNLRYLIEKNPEFKDRIDEIYFFGGIPQYYDKDTENYDFDSVSANYVLNLGLPFYSFVSKRLDLPVFDHRDWNNIVSSKNLHVSILNTLFQKKEVAKQMYINEDIYKYYSDMIPVYMENNLFARFDEYNEHIFVMRKWDKKLSSIRYYLRMKEKFSKNLKPKNNISFREFPVDVELYNLDIAANIDFLIQTYGTEEFKSIIIANELHNDIQIFSIIGAKMGIRAREILAGEYDKINVISNAPDEPPYSYLNDGLQISTGATIGNKNFELDDENKIRAEFYYGNKMVRLELKKDIYRQIIEQIEEAEIEVVGTDSYKELMRRNIINNWINYDRKVIFEEEIEEAKPGRN